MDLSGRQNRDITGSTASDSPFFFSLIALHTVILRIDVRQGGLLVYNGKGCITI